MSKRFILGVDLGQQMDPTAMVLAEHSRRIFDPNIQDTPEWDRRPKKIRNFYQVPFLERVPLGTPYTEIAERVSTIIANPKIVNETQLIVDATGVGLPVIEMMRQQGLSPIGIWITGTGDVTRTDYGYKVPKKDLVTALQIVFQSRRIQIAKELELAGVLMKELSNFRVKVSDSGKDQYEAWRTGQHDDIVLALALAVWYAERVYPQTTRFSGDRRNETSWNPLDV